MRLAGRDWGKTLYPCPTVYMPTPGQLRLHRLTLGIIRRDHRGNIGGKLYPKSKDEAGSPLPAHHRAIPLYRSIPSNRYSPLFAIINLCVQLSCPIRCS